MFRRSLGLSGAVLLFCQFQLQAQSPYEGTYRGLFYVALSGTVNQAESGLGPAVINVDAAGVVSQSGGALVGQVDGSGNIAWQTPNTYEFQTGLISEGVISSTGSRTDAGLTTTFRLDADSGAGPASPANLISRSLRLVLPTPHVDELEGAAYGNNTYVLVGRAGLILRSPNGTDWLNVPTGFGMDLLDVAFGENTFVAVGKEVDDAPLFGRVNNSTTVYYSTDDGITWNVANTGGTLDFQAVAYGNGRFVGAGRAGVYQSDDGITWTGVGIPGTTANEWTVAEFLNGRFVLFGGRSSIGAHNEIATSTDGVTWNSAQSYNNSGAQGGQAAFGNGVYAITSSTRTFTFTSDDATGASINEIGITLGGIVFDSANSRFIASDDGSIYSSTDGISWSQLATGAGNGGDEILFANGIYLKPGFELASSTDAANWTIQSMPDVDLHLPTGGSAGTDDFGFTDILHGNGRFVGFNADYTGVSFDGETWEFYSNPTGTGAFRGHVFDGARFVRIIAGDAGFSTDGINWTTETLVNAPAFVTDLTFGEGVYVTVGQSGNIYSSTDAISWTKRDAGINDHINTVHYAKGMFVGVGDSRLVYSDDGIVWNSQGAGGNTYQDIDYANGLWVRVGAHDSAGARIQTSVDGTTFTDRLLVSGGGFRFNGVAWAGSEWVAVGSSAGNQRGAPVYTSTDGVTWAEGEAAVESGLDGVIAANGALLAWGFDALLKGEFADTDSPVITAQPAGAILTPGQSLSFSVTATGAATLTYQWFKDGQPLADGGSISGATTATLTINPAQASDGGSYTVAVSNSAGSRLSSAALASAPPVITLHPQSTVQFPTSGATFTVQADGEGPFTYAWKLNGATFSDDAHFTGQGTDTLDVANLAGSHAGLYTVEVSNAAGTTVSYPAGLSLYSQVGFDIDASFPDASLAAASTGTVRVRSIAPTGDGGAYIGGLFTFNKTGGGTISNLARILPDGTLDESFAPDPDSYVHTVILLDNGNLIISGTFANVNGSPTERLVRLTSSGATDMAWTLSASSYIYGHARRADGKYFVGGAFASLGTANYRYLGLLDADGNPEAGETFLSFNSQVEALALQGEHLIVGGAFTITNPDRLIRITDTSIQEDPPSYTLDTTFNMSGAGPSGTIHDIAVPADINDGIFAAGSHFQYNGTTRTGLVKLDKDGGLVTGFNANLSFRGRAVALLGDKVLVGGAFTTVDGQSATRIALLDSTTGALDTQTINFGSGANRDVYQLIQDNGGRTFVGGDFDSFAGNANQKGLARISGGSDSPLTLAIVGHPQGASVNEGDTVTLSVAATGNGQLNFQWKKGTDNVPGATGPSLALMNVQSANAGDYTVVVTDASGGAGVTSSVATLTVTGGAQTYAQWAAGIDWMGADQTPGGDADDDKLKNIVEFAFGSNPTLNTSGELPQATVKDDMGTDYAAVTFIRNTNVSSVTIQVQAATDIGFTNMLTVMETTESLGDGLERVTVRVTTPVAAADKVYFRTNVIEN